MGLEAPIEPIPLREIKLTQATGINQYTHAVINPPSSNDRLALTPLHTKQSWSPMSKQPKDITAMDQQRADVSAESQLRSQAEKDSQSLALLDRPMCTRYSRNDEYSFRFIMGNVQTVWLKYPSTLEREFIKMRLNK